jgi:hypothetical protein
MCRACGDQLVANKLHKKSQAVRESKVQWTLLFAFWDQGYGIVSGVISPYAMIT